MTRINLVDPSHLTNKHLMAEYRELPRVFTLARNSTSLPNDIPNKYVLGTGHCKFFYNKLSWLLQRYNLLYSELLKRGYNIDKHMYDEICTSAEELIQKRYERWCVPYKPTPTEIYLNMARIAKRSKIPEVIVEVHSS